MARPTSQRWSRWPGLAGLALLAGCRVAPLGGPAEHWPAALDLVASDVSLQAVATHQRLDKPPEPQPGTPQLPDRLRIPSQLPGANAPLPQLPTGEGNEPERLRILNELFPDLPHIGDESLPVGAPLTLADLQRQALQHPGLRQAAAEVEMARGAAIQAGLPPNPSFGFEADTVGSGATAGQQGGKIEQLIKTAGKLKLAQQSALMDVVTAQIALRRAQIDRATAVRSAYFSVLVAQENERYTRAFAQLTDEIFRVTVAQVRGGQTAAYEPFQSRALADVARMNLEQARMQYRAAWRQLASAVGEPGLPLAPLAGSLDMAPPSLCYELVHDRVLAIHTDLRAAQAGVAKAQFNLRLAEVTPIPDVALKLVVQKDYTTPPFYTTANVEVGVPIPVWDRNQGNIQQAQAQLARANDEAQRARLDLLGRLADASQRYDANRRLAEVYRKQVLPDQARAYRGVILRYQQQNEVNFNDVVTAQQAFFTSLTAYLNALGAQWQAAVDLVALGQWDDLYPPEADALCGPPAPTVAPTPPLPPPATPRGPGGPVSDVLMQSLPEIRVKR